METFIFGPTLETLYSHSAQEEFSEHKYGMDVLTRCSHVLQRTAEKTHMAKVLNRRPQKKLFKPSSPNSCNIEGQSGETPLLLNSALSFGKSKYYRNDSTLINKWFRKCILLCFYLIHNLKAPQ